MEETLVCLLDSHHGQYIPHLFWEMCGERWELKEQDKHILQTGPDHPEYWEAWEDVLNYAECITEYGKYTLYHDGDLFAVHETHQWEDILLEPERNKTA